MSSGTVIDQSPPRSMPFDRIASSGQIVESHEGGKETLGSVKIVSLAKLLEGFGCTRKCDGRYMTVPFSASEKWERLFHFARSVGSFELDQNAVQEADEISPSVFVRLAQQLKCEHLFPNLSTIELKNFDISAPYFPLLLSPRLKEISVELISCEQLDQQATISLPGYEKPEPTLSVLLDDLASTSPALQSLKLRNIPRITCLTLDPVARFFHLRVLEMTNFVNVERFAEFSFLDNFPALEDLSIVATTTKYVCLGSQITPRSACLPSLKCFRIDAPLEMLLDFLESIASDNLQHLTFNHKRLIHHTSNSISKLYRGGGGKGYFARSDFLEILSSRWPEILKELVIVSSTTMKCDLHYLTRLQVIENLVIQGCSMFGILDVFVERSCFRDSLHSLCLTEAAVPLRLLKQIAEYAPSLTTLSLSLDIQDTSYANEIRITTHPLQLLEIHHGPNHNPDMNPDNFLQLIRMARYLNALFPDIRSLTSSTMESEWEKVWQLLKLCQDSRNDAKCGKLIEESFFGSDI